MEDKTEQQIKDLTKRVQKLEHVVSQLLRQIDVLRAENLRLRVRSENINHGLRALSTKFTREKE